MTYPRGSSMSERKKAKRPEKESTEARQAGGLVHGAQELPEVVLKSYKLELQDEEGFIGDRASGRAFRALLDELRAQVSEAAKDPLGKKPTKDLSKKQLDKILVDGDPNAAGVIQGAIEEF